MSSKSLMNYILAQCLTIGYWTFEYNMIIDYFYIKGNITWAQIGIPINPELNFHQHVRYGFF